MDEVPHTLDAVRVGQHFANRLVDTARYSAHRPASSEQELADLIYSTAPVFSARFEVRAAPLTLALACLLVGCLCDGGSRGTWGGARCSGDWHAADSPQTPSSATHNALPPPLAADGGRQLRRVRTGPRPKPGARALSFWGGLWGFLLDRVRTLRGAVCVPFVFFT